MKREEIKKRLARVNKDKLVMALTSIIANSKNHVYRDIEDFENAIEETVESEIGISLKYKKKFVIEVETESNSDIDLDIAGDWVGNAFSEWFSQESCVFGESEFEDVIRFEVKEVDQA